MLAHRALFAMTAQINSALQSFKNKVANYVDKLLITIRYYCSDNVIPFSKSGKW